MKKNNWIYWEKGWDDLKMFCNKLGWNIVRIENIGKGKNKIYVEV